MVLWKGQTGKDFGEGKFYQWFVEGDEHVEVIGMELIIIIDMNITRLNFKEAFPYLLNSISEANFVALDFQMSGIVSAFTLDPSLTDSIQTRYFKTKCKAQRFIPLQLGICPLTVQPDRVVYSPYNLYLYPLSLTERDAEEFSFNSESMRFLAKNNFDFNRLFYEGVPFISSQRVKKYQIKKQQIKLRQQQTKQYILQSPGAAAFLNMKLQEVTNWLNHEPIKKQQQPDTIATTTATPTVHKDPILASEANDKQIYVDIQFVKVRAYESLIYVIKKKYPSLDLQFEYMDVNKQKLQDWNFLARKYIKITRLTPEDLQKQQSPATVPPPKQQREKKQIQISQIESLALNKIWQTIKTKKIPIVVHNGFIDLMHLYHRFIDDLPNSEEAYRHAVGVQFPLIYDTKYICNNSPVLFNKLGKDTSLGNCYKVLREIDGKQSNSSGSEGQGKQLAKSQMNAQCSQYKFDQQEHHEAGYDALMTGYTFINAMKTLHHPPSSLLSPQFHKTVQYYCNKIPLGNIRVPYNFNQKNQNYQADGNRQFYFTCLDDLNNGRQAPQSFMLKEEQIYQHFSEKFGPVKIIWEDRNQFNFTLSFIKGEDQEKLAKMLDGQGYALYNINQSDKYLISTKLAKQKKLFTAKSSENSTTTTTN